MIYDHFTEEQVSEYWGRIVIGIGAGSGKYELELVLHDIAKLQFAAGIQYEIDRRVREITERLLGPQHKTCEMCKEIFVSKQENDSWCGNCIPF